MPKDADHAPVLALDPTPEPALALWLVEQAEAHGTLLYIARGEGRLDRVTGATRVFAGERVEVLVLPPWDVLPYDRAPPSAGVVGRRVEALAALARPAERPRLVLTSAEAALQRVRPPRARRGAELVLARGETWCLDALRAALAERGYHHLDERVDEPGEVAVRGRVVDVFPAGRSQPVHLLVQHVGDAPGASGAVDGGAGDAGEIVGIVSLHDLNNSESGTGPDPHTGVRPRASSQDDGEAALWGHRGSLGGRGGCRLGRQAQTYGCESWNGGRKVKVFLGAVALAVALSVTAQYVFVHVVEQSSREAYSRPTARS